MSIEVDILNGEASWPLAAPLLDSVWSADVMQTKPWRKVKWAHADLRVLIDAGDGSGLACHVGIFFRTVTWNGRKVHIGGIGGVATREDCRGLGYASLGLEAAVHTFRANEAVRFALLFCEPHNQSFYEARGWHRFAGEIWCEQPEGRVRFEAMTPFVFDVIRAPRQGLIDLCGLPW